MLVVGAQRQHRAAGALIVPGGALGASAWLRWHHGADRPGCGRAEGLALLAGANRAGGWGIFHPCKKVRGPSSSHDLARTRGGVPARYPKSRAEHDRPMQIAALRTQTSAEPSTGSDLTGHQMSAGCAWDS